jgi:hypothetical protein
MKTKNIILLLVCFSVLSCSKETGNEPGIFTEIRIKRKLFYDNIEDTIPKKILEYQYNNQKELEKIYHYLGNDLTKYNICELFVYNIDSKPFNKLTYHYANDSLGWVLTDSTEYRYQDKKLIYEITYYLGTSDDTIAYKYLYEKSNIIEKRKYYNQEFENLTKYEYSEDLCTKEFIFTDSIGLNQIEYTIHSYSNRILSKSEKFLNNNSNIQIITYTYNNEGYLIIEQSEQTDFTITKPLDYVIRYEYY